MKVELMKSLDRLLSINWQNEISSSEADINLVGEYIRRVAIMTDRYQLNLNSPFFSPASIIDISGESSDFAIQKFIKAVGESVALKNTYSRRVCECYLQWCEGVDSEVEIAAFFPDIFDPLITLLERGGSFGLHHGEVLVGHGAIPLKHWKSFTAAKPMYKMKSEQRND